MKITSVLQNAASGVSFLMLLSLAMTSSAFAQDYGADQAVGYVGVRLGHIELEHVDDDGSFNIGLYGGAFVQPWLAIEGAVDFQDSDFYWHDGDWSVGLYTTSRQTTALSAGLKLMPVTRGPIRPFLGAGVGYYFSEYTYDDGFYDVHDRIDEGGFYAGGGLELFGYGSAARGFTLTWDNRWLFTEKETYREDHVKADGWTTSLGCTFRF